MKPYQPGPTKAIGYAYPSSPAAVKFHMSTYGCYTVVLRDDDYQAEPPRYVAGFATYAEAQAYADRSDLPYSVWSK